VLYFWRTDATNSLINIHADIYHLSNMKFTGDKYWASWTHPKLGWPDQNWPKCYSSAKNHLAKSSFQNISKLTSCLYHLLPMIHLLSYYSCCHQCINNMQANRSQTFKQPAIGIPRYCGLWYTGNHTSKRHTFVFKCIHILQWCQQIRHSCSNINKMWQAYQWK